jgi:ATP-dependent helicase HepA
MDVLSRWKSGDNGAARIDQLLAVLRERRAQDAAAVPSQRHKALVFAGFPGAASEVLTRLHQRLSETEVAGFLAEMEANDKEREVRRFRRPTGAWVLVSDETGGEGRNFQFATDLYHLDTPWHAARVEQRIGRLDRLGRESVREDVCSHVIVASAGEERGLADCYLNGLRVYRESISGLEFALRAVDDDLVRKAVAGGADALAAYVEPLRQLAEQERVRDESEFMTDEATGGEYAALRLGSLKSGANDDEYLERAFCSLWRHLCDAERDVKWVNDEDAPPGSIKTFQPSDLSRCRLDLPGNVDGVQKEQRGTFRRTIAQQRPDLQFFNVGNPLFDGVLKILQTQRPGRCYAVECIDSTRPHEGWAGFEFVFYAVADLAALEGNAGMQARARTVIQKHRASIFVSSTNRVEQNADWLRRLRGGLSPKERRNWRDLSRQGSALWQMVGSWRDTVEKAHSIALLQAKAELAVRMDPVIQAECRTIDEQLALLEKRPSADTIEAQGLRLLQTALRNWSPLLDSTGFLCVNRQQWETMRAKP